MKFLFSLLTIVLLTDSCKTPKQAIENSEKQIKTAAIANKQEMTDKQKNVANRPDMVFTYKATSRGYANYVSVSEQTVQTSSDRSLKKIETFSCDKKDWEALKGLVKPIKPQDLKNLKAPSVNYQRDGAAAATLTITQGNIAYITPTFDEGNPPNEIKKLVNKLLAIGTQMKKQ